MATNARYLTAQVPDCPSATHSAHAVKHKGCICPGPAEDLAAERDRERVRLQARRHAGGVTPLGEPDPGQQPPEPTHQASRLELALLRRTDLPCRDEDPRLFTVVGTGPASRLQEAAARAVCRRCPAQDTCLTVALQRGDVGVFVGGTSDEDRRAIRARMAGWAA